MLYMLVSSTVLYAFRLLLWSVCYVIYLFMYMHVLLFGDHRFQYKAECQFTLLYVCMYIRMNASLYVYMYVSLDLPPSSSSCVGEQLYNAARDGKAADVERLLSQSSTPTTTTR